MRKTFSQKKYFVYKKNTALTHFTVYIEQSINCLKIQCAYKKILYICARI
jgi:hypothetical protein